jgi:hypothetical protein
MVLYYIEMAVLYQLYGPCGMMLEGQLKLVFLNIVNESLVILGEARS